MHVIMRATAVAGLCLLFGCESSPPAPSGFEESLEELSGAVTPVEADYLEANRTLFQSLDTFIPYLNGTLSENVSEDPNRLSPALLGRTFAFDGSAYQESGLPGAPTDGIRFLLYEVGVGGVPLLDRSTGSVDVRSITAAMPVTMAIRVVRDSVLVLGMDVTGLSSAQLTWTGGLSTPSGNRMLPWGGDILGDQHTFYAQLPNHVRMSYSVLGEGAMPENVLVQVLKAGASPAWELYADIIAEPDGTIMEGPLRVATRDGAHLAACLSGTLEMPVFQSAAAGDCVYFGLSPIDASSSELNALQGSYLVIRNLYLVSRRLLDTGLAGLGGSAPQKTAGPRRP